MYPLLYNITGDKIISGLTFKKDQKHNIALMNISITNTQLHISRKRLQHPKTKIIQ